LSEVEYKYCVRTKDGTWLYTDDLDLVRQLLGIQPRAEVPVITKAKPEIKPVQIVETATGYRIFYGSGKANVISKHTISSIEQTLAKYGTLTIRKLYAMFSGDYSPVTIRRALRVLRHLGKAKLMKKGVYQHVKIEEAEKPLLERTAGGYRVAATATVAESTVKKVFERLVELAKEKPVTMRDILPELGISKPTLDRALLVLHRLGKVRRYRGKRGAYLYTPIMKTFETETMGDIVLSEEQRQAVESVGKALKEEWSLRER